MPGYSVDNSAHKKVGGYLALSETIEKNRKYLNKKIYLLDIYEETSKKHSTT